MPIPGVPLAGTAGRLCLCCDDLEKVRTTGSPINKACSWLLSPVTKIMGERARKS